MTGPRAPLVAIVCAVAGGTLTVLVDSPWALGLGVALLIAFIAIGAAAIATPEYLGRDDDPGD